MVTAKESQTYQQFSAWTSSELDHQQLSQLENLPCFPHSLPSTMNVGLPAHLVPNLRGSQSVQPESIVSQQLPPHWNDTSPILSLYFKDLQCGLPNALENQVNPVHVPCTSQKRFLVFDQSRNNTRLFFSHSFPPNPILAAKTAANAHGLFGDKLAAQVDQEFSGELIFQEKWDENHLIDGRSDDMREDTEEINALLYSDDSNDDSDDDTDGETENDEVISTGHTTFPVEEGRNKENQLIEEVASSDGSIKRQKLLDGGYKKSLMDGVNPIGLASPGNYSDDAESSCAHEGNLYNDIDSSKRSKKVKIRESLKILQTIVPDLESNDPLLIIDKAIGYLKSLRHEAEAIGFNL